LVGQTGGKKAQELARKGELLESQETFTRKTRKWGGSIYVAEATRSQKTKRKRGHSDKFLQDKGRKSVNVLRFVRGGRMRKQKKEVVGTERKRVGGEES